MPDIRPYRGDLRVRKGLDRGDRAALGPVGLPEVKAWHVQCKEIRFEGETVGRSFLQATKQPNALSIQFKISGFCRKQLCFF